MFLSAVTVAFAQDDAKEETVLTPSLKIGKVLVDGDSIQYMEMQNVYVYPEPTFKTKRQQQAYMRLVRNVKKVLPIAKQARQMLIETAEYIETLPTQKERDEHLKRVEAAIVAEYKPKMKKLTFSQGKLLINLLTASVTPLLLRLSRPSSVLCVPACGRLLHGCSVLH